MRFETIERLAEVAREHDVDFTVVAGDVFDANTVDRTDVVIQACERLKAFDTPIYLLPGNHDHLGAPNAVLTSRTFETNAPDEVSVLDERLPRRVAGGRAALLPAPLLHRNERGETTDHFDPELGADIAPIRIGVAHGSVETFGDDLDGEATNLVDPSRAASAELDYLALGDWHGTKRIQNRVWYAGTPEPDNYLDNDPGHALVVEVDEEGSGPSVEKIETAKLEWAQMDWTFDSSEDRIAFERHVDDLSDPLRTVLQLRYEGSLPIDELNRFETSVLEPLRGRLFELRARGDLIPRADLDDFEIEELEGFVAAAARRLLAAATESESEPAEDWSVVELLDSLQNWEGDGRPDAQETAARALHLLYRIVHRQEK